MVEYPIVLSPKERESQMGRSCGPAICLALLVARSADATQVEHLLPRGSTLTADEADRVVTDREMLDRISVESQGSVDPSLEVYWSTGEFELFGDDPPVLNMVIYDFGRHG
jgi:hypothetical protein